jgi:hypothetical protein
MVNVIDRIDEFGLAAWIALMVVSFALFWPAGLAVLAFLIWSGRMGCSRHRGFGRWQENWHRRREEWRAGSRASGSGNSAFDEYRTETIRRLEDEEKEFHDFLARLRQAKDRAEFDQFMADRRRRAAEGTSAPEPGQA